jgi:hypothetical protein
MFSSKNRRHSFSVKASLDSSSEVLESIDVGGPHIGPQRYSVKIPVGDRHVSIFFLVLDGCILFQFYLEVL